MVILFSLSTRDKTEIIGFAKAVGNTHRIETIGIE
jgi:hypothetical protein